MNLTLINSPGRGSSGKLRNFKAMNATKLAGVIDDLVAYGEDSEALGAACAVAGVEAPTATKEAPGKKRSAAAASGNDDPLGIVPAKIPQKADDKHDSASLAAGRHEAILEPKYDGHRILVHRDSAGVHIYAGSGVDKTRLVPTLARELERLPIGTWLDGEGIVGEGKGAESGHWGSVQTILGNRNDPAPSEADLRFAAFDLLAYDGIPAYGLRLADRKEILFGAVNKLNSKMVFEAPALEATDKNYEWLLDQGYEGGVVKWAHIPYAFNKRGAGWWKLKATATADVIVIGFKPGKGSFAGLIGAIIYGQVKDGKIVERGSCSGMDMDLRREITQHQREWIGKVIEILHWGVMPDSEQFRSPQYKRTRTDKNPKQCRWE